jgi:hypothetical protein
MYLGVSSWQQATKHWFPGTEELKKYGGRHYGSVGGVIPHRIINIYLTQEQLPFLARNKN